jgi:hypothetical protein
MLDSASARRGGAAADFGGRGADRSRVGVARLVLPSIRGDGANGCGAIEKPAIAVIERTQMCRFVMGEEY